MAQVGLKNIHVALFTDELNGVTTYGVPKKIAHAITANITPNSETATLYGDDQAVETAEAMGDIDVEIGITDLSVEDYAYLLGKTVDANGGVSDNVNDIAPLVALGFEVPLSGNKGKRMYWYYKGRFQIPSSEHATKQGSTEFQTPTISAKFMPRTDGEWRYRLDSNATNATVITSWFTEVQEKPAIATP